MYAKTPLLVAATLVLPFASALPLEDSTKPACRYLPVDAGWPSPRQWSAFNQSISGRLIVGKPLAESCHGDSFAASTCAPIREQYNLTDPYFPDPVNVMSPLFLRDSCSPYTDPSAPCTLGNLASYAVNVSRAEDVKAAVKFVKEKNIRLTIKNTGHDYLGRSTGKGSLALWTHNLKEISFTNYTSPQYTGPAIKIGAGVQAFEAYGAAYERGFRLTGGYCPTVGLAGGWVSGGGTGALASLYGLGADNTLEFEVVTTEGKQLVTSPTKNSDLFWALNGGGGGTYAVVISQTIKLHADGPVAGAELSFSNTGDDKAYWAAVEAWQKQLLVFDTIRGLNTFWGFTDKLFELYFSTLPDAEEAAIAAAFSPFIDTLKKLGVKYTYRTTSNPTYYEHFAQYTPGLPYGEYTTNNLLGGRLISRSAVRDNLPKLMAAFRNITTKNPTHPFRVNGIANNVTHARVGNTPSSNSVLPQWRDSLYWLNMDVYFDLDGPISVVDNLQKELNVNQDMLKALTPGGGSYVNEATYDNPAWKVDYWGANYAKLLAVKQKYDPSFSLYGPASVGSDHWKSDAEGRLCKA
ncbi:hypothetical protein NUW58_g1502 [Xylaria curta]|uniref:Uncharacterized protein n=1 Tax=Xylaria curta TaxID=42375 RepID=A0ACC1PKW6_9PEZI|nr:hypothetical protein NUW58_g1502 [Xylaria curta]